MSKNIIVISHRRSGTHLTIDSIINNFFEYNKSSFLNLNEHKIKQPEYTKNFLKKIKQNNKIIKTHFLPDFSIYNLDNQLTKKIKILFKNSKLIYVYRNGLDVMVSLYEYMKKYDNKIKSMNFDEFLKTENNFDNTKEKFNRTVFWKYHIKSWQNSEFNDILYLKYEDFINNYKNTLIKIKQKFNLNIKDNIVDIRIDQNSNKLLKKFMNRFKGLQKTSVSARKGKIGDYINYFSEKSLKEFLKENENFLKNLGY